MHGLKTFVHIFLRLCRWASYRILTHVVLHQCYLINNVMYKLHSTTAFQDSEEESFASGERGARAILSAGTHKPKPKVRQRGRMKFQDTNIRLSLTGPLPHPTRICQKIKTFPPEESGLRRRPLFPGLQDNTKMPLQSP